MRFSRWSFGTSSATPLTMGEMQIFALRAVEDHAMRVNQCQLVAIANKGDGSALCQLNAQAIRQDALHAGGFHPGDLFDLAAAGVQRHAQNAAVAILDKLLEDSFPADDVIPVDFD